MKTINSCTRTVSILELQWLSRLAKVPQRSRNFLPCLSRSHPPTHPQMKKRVWRIALLFSQVEGSRFPLPYQLINLYLIPLGLLTPVLRQCDSQDIYSLSRSWKVSHLHRFRLSMCICTGSIGLIRSLTLLSFTQELVRKSLRDRLTASDTNNAHFFISNLDSFGVEQFAAILPTHAGTILAVSAIKPTVAVMNDGTVGVEDVMKITATCDHRVIQGAQCAAFLRDLANMMDNNIKEVMY